MEFRRLTNLTMQIVDHDKVEIELVYIHPGARKSEKMIELFCFDSAKPPVLKFPREFKSGPRGQLAFPGFK